MAAMSAAVKSLTNLRSKGVFLMDSIDMNSLTVVFADAEDASPVKNLLSEVERLDI
jgi:hypothetical protein